MNMAAAASRRLASRRSGTRTEPCIREIGTSGINKRRNPENGPMLRSKRDSSDRGASTRLVDLFIARTGDAGKAPQVIIEDLVEELRRQTGLASARSLDRYLEARNVVEQHCDSDIGCDG